MGETFGDAKKHQIVAEMYGRLRRAIEVFCRSEAKNNVLRSIQNFVPHLKRTDKDVGALPLYSAVPASRKTNREHCLLCVLSYTVQKFWDYRDPLIDSQESNLLELLTHITFLEKVAKQGLAQYRVYGKYPVFNLVHVDDIERLEQEAEAADVKLKERMKQENIEATAAEREGPIATEEPTKDQVQEDDKETRVKNAVTKKSAERQTATEAKDAKDDAAMQETADKCNEDCDSCIDRVCDAQLGSPEEQAAQTAALKELGYIDAGDQDQLDGGALTDIEDESGEDTGDEGEVIDVNAEDTFADDGEDIDHPLNCDCEVCYDTSDQQVDKKQIEDAEKKDADKGKSPPMPE